VAGCGHSDMKAAPSGREPQPSGTLIAEADRDFDFGAVVATAGRKMTHAYHLVNRTGHDVNILNIINHKTCCGIVRAKTGVLAPGESADLEIDLVVGGRFGQVVNTTEVVTDLPEEESIALRTSAEAVAPVRVEEVSRGDRTIIIGSKDPHRAEFRVFASGTTSEPPIDLDRVQLQSTSKVEWVSAKEDSCSDEGLEVQSRRFIAFLDALGTPGERRAEILLKRGDEALDRATVSWEVVSPLSVSPKVIVLEPGQHGYRVVIASRDRNPFRVTRVECNDSGLTGRAEGDSAALGQILEVNGAPRTESKRGAFTVFTDHPAQGRLDVPFVVLY
ncbi:MAG: hypothetical protein ACP5XB_25255, partial [Isosphaeraceae bacterium]